MKVDLSKHTAKGNTILFAEDDEVLLTVYRKPLEKAGYHVKTAHDGLVTMKKLFFNAPDLLILDLMLPRFDGEKLLQFIWSPPRLSKIPVIVLTSKHCIDPEYERLMKFAAKYLIKQDCTPAILLKAVQEQLSSQLQEKPASVIAPFEPLNGMKLPVRDRRASRASFHVSNSTCR